MTIEESAAAASDPTSPRGLGLAAALRSEMSAVVACGTSGLGIDAAEAEARQLRAIQRQAAAMLSAQRAAASAPASSAAATDAPAPDADAAAVTTATLAITAIAPVAAAAAAVDGLPGFAADAASACDAIEASISRAKAAYVALLQHYAMGPATGAPASYASLSGEGLLRDMSTFVRETAATEAKIRDRLARAARAQAQAADAVMRRQTSQDKQALAPAKTGTAKAGIDEVSSAEAEQQEPKSCIASSSSPGMRECDIGVLTVNPSAPLMIANTANRAASAGSPLASALG